MIWRKIKGDFLTPPRSDNGMKQLRVSHSELIKLSNPARHLAF